MNKGKLDLGFPIVIDFEVLFYRLISSLTLADHMGDVCDDVDQALKLAGNPINFDSLDDLGVKLRDADKFETIWGTK